MTTRAKFTGRGRTATFESATNLAPPPIKSPKIPGGKYKAIDTEDGYFTVLDVPLMSSIDKGVKGAPTDIGKDWFDGAVKFAQDEFNRGSFVAPAHIGHNKPIELTDPAGAGFVLPNRVGTMDVNGKKNVPTVFGNVKMRAAAFEKAQKGELPYLSIEANWDQKIITSLSFLDSKPPYFHYPLFTIGEVIKDATAHFESNLMDVARFEVGADPKDPDHQEPDGDEKSQKCCGHCSSYSRAIAQMSKAMGMKFDDISGGTMPTDPKTPDSAPVQPAVKPADGDAAARMQADAVASAKFEGRIAALEDKDKNRDAQDKSRALELKALEKFKGKVLGEKTKAGIAKFAAVGEEALNAFVDSVLEVAPSTPPATFEAFQGAPKVEATDPAIAKFAQQGQPSLEAAMKALAEHRTLAKSKGFTSTAEEYLNFRVPELIKR